MAELASHTATKLRLKVLDDAIESGRLERVRRLMNSLPAAEIGHLLESVPPPKRLLMWEAVDPEDEGEVLVHVNDEVRSGLIAQMDDAALVAAWTLSALLSGPRELTRLTLWLLEWRAWLYGRSRPSGTPLGRWRALAKETDFLSAASWALYGEGSNAPLPPDKIREACRSASRTDFRQAA